MTLVTFDGNEVEMPMAFDDFSLKADRDYSDVPETAAERRLDLRCCVMQQNI